MTEEEINVKYQRVAVEIRSWVELHRNESFDQDYICRDLDIMSREGRKYAAIELSKLVKKATLGKDSPPNRPPIYHYIDKELPDMDWVNAQASAAIDIKWPYGVQDESEFGFADRVVIPEKGLIVLAGVTNTGKSCFLRNMLWRNMDNYHCIYFSSETSAEDFADYTTRMPWASGRNGNGASKFELKWRTKDWKHFIQPNSINFIDWLNLGDRFYNIGDVLHELKEPLEHGILVVAIQKDPHKDLGMGGMWGEHLSSLYITMDYDRLTVVKAKKWHTDNPNNKTWGFTIVDRGANFHNIRPLKKCGKCWQGKIKGQECSNCNGTGWVEEEYEW